MKMNNKTLTYLGLGGLAVYFLFVRKNEKPATEEEMANFLSNKRRTKVKAKLKNAKAKLKKHIDEGGVDGATHRRLVGRINRLEKVVKGGRMGARRRRAMAQAKAGGFFGGND